MTTTYEYQDLSRKDRPAPNTSLARRVTDWTKLSNENLKFALDVLSLHQSPFEWEVDFEIARRIEAGTWLDLDAPPPLNHNVPKWLTVFPFSLLWHQKRRKTSVGGWLE